MALSALKEQRSDQLKQSFRANGLPDEMSPLRQVPRCGGNASRCDHNTNILAIIPNSAGQLEAVDAPTWHFYVRNDHLNVGNSRENMERLVRVSRLHDLEPSIIQHIHQHHADKCFVLDNENERANIRFFLKHIGWNGDESSSFLRPRGYSACATHGLNPRHDLLRHLDCLTALLGRLRERDRDR